MRDLLLQDLLSKRMVVVVSHAVSAILRDRQTMTRRFSKFDAVSNEHLVAAPGQVALDVFQHRLYKRRTSRIEGHQHASGHVMACFAVQQIEGLQRLPD